MNLLQELLRSKLTRGGGEAVLIQKTITANGTFAAAEDNADGYSSVTVEVPGGGGRYTLLASGSYTWAGGSSTLSIPISFTGTPKMFGLIADEPLADTAQMVSVCKLAGSGLLPDVLHSPDQRDFFATGWGQGSDNAVVHEIVSLGDPKMSTTQMVCTKFSETYPWKANTYSWYIWGENSGR